MCRKFDFCLIGLICTLLLAAGATGSEAGDGIEFAHSRLVLVTGSGRHEFEVEMATSPAQRRLGLMHRPRMAANAGMLFDYGMPRLISMWMKNTVIPLDMIFIAGNGRIISIAENTTPFSLTAIGSGSPARAVLEINAGTVARLHIKPGDRVEHDIFANAGN